MMIVSKRTITLHCYITLLKFILFSICLEVERGMKCPDIGIITVVLQTVSLSK